MQHELPRWILPFIDLQLRVVRLRHLLSNRWRHRLNSVRNMQCRELLECGCGYVRDLWFRTLSERLRYVVLHELRRRILCCLCSWMRILCTWNCVAGIRLKLVQQL